jgi:ribosomal protein L29
MSDIEIDEEIVKARKDLLSFRCKIALGEDIKSSEVKAIKRDIARMLTVKQEKANAAVVSSGSDV